MEVQNFNIIYHQIFLERVISYFIVEVTEDLAIKAWDKWSEIKFYSTQNFKRALENRKNSLEIIIKPISVLIPLNRNNFKGSRFFALNLDNIVINNGKHTEMFSKIINISLNKASVSVNNIYNFSIICQ